MIEIYGEILKEIAKYGVNIDDIEHNIHDIDGIVDSLEAIHNNFV